MKTIMIIIATLVGMKIISLIITIIIKFKYSKIAKHKDNDDLNVACISKDIDLFWDRTDHTLYITPTCSIYYCDNVFSITFEWLKIYYSNTWRIRTFADENNMVKTNI